MHARATSPTHEYHRLHERAHPSDARAPSPVRTVTLACTRAHPDPHARAPSPLRMSSLTCTYERPHMPARTPAPACTSAPPERPRLCAWARAVRTSAFPWTSTGSPARTSLVHAHVRALFRTHERPPLQARAHHVHERAPPHTRTSTLTCTHEHPQRTGALTCTHEHPRLHARAPSPVRTTPLAGTNDHRTYSPSPARKSTLASALTCTHESPNIHARM
jgi:hypothetical protein